MKYYYIILNIPLTSNQYKKTMTNQEELYIDNYTDEMLFDYIENLTNKTKLSNNNNDNTNNQLSNTKIIRPWDNHRNKQNKHMSVPKVNKSDQLTLIKIQPKCKECGNTGLKVIDGKITCTKCSLIFSIKIENSTEKGAFNKEDGNLSVNTGHTLVSTSLFPGYINTNIIGNNSFNLMNKLNMWNNTLTADEKNVMEVFKKIREICNKSNFSKKIEDTAKSLYLNLKKISTNKDDENQVNRRNMNREDKQNIMIAVCIQKSCDMNKDARNKIEIAQLCNIDIKAMTKGEKLYCEIIGSSKINVNMPQITPHELIPRLCQKLEITDQYKNIGIRISINIEKLYICSNSAPQSLAATAILILVIGYKLPITIAQIAKCSYMAESTIDKCYKKMEPYLAIIINDEKTNALVNDINKIIENMTPPKKFIEIHKNIKKRNHLEKNQQEYN